MPDQINQLSKPIFPEMDPLFQAHYSEMTDAINGLLGYNGTIPLADHLDLGGKRIMNVGTPVASTDAVSNAFAETKYSPSVIAPQLESSGAFALKSVRRINDANQREQVSSYLNDLMSSVPSANAILPILTTMGGGVQVVVPSSTLNFADGTSTILTSRTDLLSFPASYAITSISSSGSTVTAVLASPPALVAGQTITIDGVTPSSFNGTFTLTSVTGSTITYQLSLGTVTGAGGTAYKNGVYFYAAIKRSTSIFLLGPFAADTAQNRLDANFDGFQILAVVVITSTGGQVQLSGGGGSAITGSPTAGAFF